MIRHYFIIAYYYDIIHCFTAIFAARCFHYAILRYALRLRRR